VGLLISLTIPAIAAQIEAAFNTVNITVNGSQVATIGEYYALADESSVPLRISYKDTTYLPIRKLSELLGIEITWYGETNTISVTTTSNEVPQSFPAQNFPEQIEQRQPTPTSVQLPPGVTIHASPTPIPRQNHITEESQFTKMQRGNMAGYFYNDREYYSIPNCRKEYPFIGMYFDERNIIFCTYPKEGLCSKSSWGLKSNPGI
jgi:hypothetical protein